MLRALVFVPAFVAVVAAAERPGRLRPEEIREYAELDGVRKRVVEEALALASREGWLRYQFGSADPARGGLDCSGAVHFILARAGLSPRRSSAAQFQWVKESGGMTEVAQGVHDPGHAAFAKLLPGDLLFWSGTYEPADGRAVPVSHVQIYLGHEKATGKPVMIGASDGRSYRGTAREGYGVFDFKLPRPGSKARFLGYGLPTQPSP
jgi:cell wall-associated NlpC family hydrolase